MRTSYLVTPNWIPVRKVQMQLVTKCHLEGKRPLKQMWLQTRIQAIVIFSSTNVGIFEQLRQEM